MSCTPVRQAHHAPHRDAYTTYQSKQNSTIKPLIHQIPHKDENHHLASSLTTDHYYSSATIMNQYYITIAHNHEPLFAIKQPLFSHQLIIPRHPYSHIPASNHQFALTTAIDSPNHQVVQRSSVNHGLTVN